ncbi:MAG: TonB family protein [Spirochaetales bacterium]|nr:TonB family protein [Spirochaetales bacterium]
MHRKEKKRVIIAFIVSVLAHVVLLTGLGLFISLAPKEDIQSTGPVFVQLESDRPVKPADEKKIEPEPVKEEAPETEVNKPLQSEIASVERQRPVQNINPKGPEEKPLVVEEKVDSPSAVKEDNPVISYKSDVSENTLPEATVEKATSAPKPTATPGPTETPKPTEESGLKSDLLRDIDLVNAGGSDNSDTDVDSTTSNANQPSQSSISYVTSKPTLVYEGQKERTVISESKVVLPDWVYKRGLSLFVHLTFDLTYEGNLINIVVDKSSGYTDVDEAVKTALQHYLIEPSKHSKDTISGVVSFPITPK